MVAEIHALAPEPEDAATAGVLRLKRKPKDAKQKRVVVFYIDDVAYTVPANPGAEISLKALELLETRGEQAATYYSMKAMLGEEGYRALTEYEDLPPDALQQVMKRIQEIALGATEGPKAS